MKKQTQYSDKPVNPKYYATIEVSGTCTEPTKELTYEEFKNGEQGIVWMDEKTGKLSFKEDMIDNNQGTSGSSGFGGHSDWFGPPNGGMGWSSTAPSELVKLIQYRNERLSKEWMGAMEHDVSGSTIEEVERKSKELEQRVLHRFDEITKRYEQFDEIIYAISKLIDPKGGK